MEPVSSTQSLPTRREFLIQTGRLAAASALAGVALPPVHGGESGGLRMALIGCGGRGTGAVSDAIQARVLPVKLVAMADVFRDRLQSSYENLKRQFADYVDVPEDRKFLGFDGYKHAMDCLRPGDIAILTTPPAFRWVHYAYAIQKGLHVFMEKPVTVDGPTSKRMLEQAKEAQAKGLKCGVGLMSRHSRALQQLAERVQNGELGEILLQRGYRMHGPAGYFASVPKPADMSDLLYQVRRFHSFLWASGGCFSDFYIHIIDHLCWMKNAWPERAQALGGRHYKTDSDGRPFVDQNFDVYSVEYTYADGTKLMFDGRCMTGCQDLYASYMHGTKGMAVVSSSGDCGLPSRIFKSQRMRRSDLIWESYVPEGESNPYVNEWRALLTAIQQDQPFHELERGVMASVVTSMGRMAAHTGREITLEEMLNCEHEMAPGLDRLTYDSPAPLQPGPDGRYPIPMPGRHRNREY
ncbi:MAG: Gfo/Idh/MocA family oxidoreductase [Verrucomicrobiota bacterium]|nr:Gfo/Idh/MocA family oxidoreductase [Limisphaera sp.]MDW8381863.1 Gfo/Idh/MocA family oxidoreductase [Verrucomicrobiota bacterium]